MLDSPLSYTCHDYEEYIMVGSNHVALHKYNNFWVLLSARYNSYTEKHLDLISCWVCSTDTSNWMCVQCPTSTYIVTFDNSKLLRYQHVNIVCLVFVFVLHSLPIIYLPTCSYSFWKQQCITHCQQHYKPPWWTSST
jgi:hypothetical protein